MKLRSEKNRVGDEWLDAETGAANVTPTDPFEEGEETLIRPDDHHEIEEPGDELEQEETEKTQETSDRSEFGAREKLLRGRANRRPRTIVGEMNNSL